MPLQSSQLPLMRSAFSLLDERVISVAAYEKVFIASSVAAMPFGSLATTRRVSTWPPFSQRIKQTVMLHFYFANLMRDALLNDRVELRILGDVGAKIRVMNFDTPGVQFREIWRENKSGRGQRGRGTMV
ncbi:uncharacterized protein DS421_9g270890 [Arachis hypogaea]|nr:uncharacterized protein DS421_9g270890 [Arachis hypogaea]